jgi:hypothetical protein
MLHISVAKYNKNFLYTECETKEERAFLIRRNSYYVRRFYYQGIGFYIGRIFFCKNDFKYHIEVNPSDFPSYKEFKIFCEKLFWKLSNGRVTRIDPSVVFDANTYPADLFRHTAYFRKVSLSSSYPDIKFKHKAGVFTTYTLGIKPRRLSCYVYKNWEEQHLTNFELQISRLKSNNFIVQTVKDLKNILKINPFKGIGFKNIYVSNPYGKFDDSKKAKIAEVRMLVFAEGYHCTRANYGKNFDRDYGKFFQDLMVSKNSVLMTDVLERSWRKGMKEWFKG